MDTKMNEPVLPQTRRRFLGGLTLAAAARASVIVEFAPVTSSRIGELAATFDIVLGFTPEA